MAGITDLPAELLLEIFSYSPTIASTVNLALTCKHTYAVFNISKDKIVHKFVDRDAYNRYELAALDYFRPESTLLHPKQLQFFEENPQYFGTNFARYLWTGFARIDARLDPTPGKIGVKELWRLQHTREKMMAIAKTVVNEEEEDRNKRITLADFQLAFSVALYQLRALWEYPSTPTIKAFTEDCRKDPSLRIPVPMRSFGLDILFDHSICATIAEKDQLTTRTVAGKLDELREKIKNDNVDKEIYDVAPPFSFVKQFPCGACEEAECAEILADIKKNGRPDNDWGGELDMGYARIQYSMRYGERIYPSYKLYSYTVGWKETVKKDGTAGKKKRIEQDLTVHVPDFNKAGRYRQWQKVEIRKARARATAAAKKAEGKAKAIKKKNKSEEEEKESEAPKEPNQQSEKKTASVEMEEWERLEKEAVWRPDWEEYGERQYGDSPSYSEVSYEGSGEGSNSDRGGFNPYDSYDGMSPSDEDYDDDDDDWMGPPPGFFFGDRGPPPLISRRPGGGFSIVPPPDGLSSSAGPSGGPLATRSSSTGAPSSGGAPRRASFEGPPGWLLVPGPDGKGVWKPK